MTKAFTKKLIDSASTQDKDLYLWDSSLAGFGIRIKPSGLKTFLLQYRNSTGRSRRVSIGKYGVLTLSQAKDQAKKLLGQVAAGEDPAEERNKLRSGLSISKLADRYMNDHCRHHCKESTIAAHNWLLKKFIRPLYGSRSIYDISKSDIIALKNKLSNTPYNFNRTLGLLKAMYQKAVEWGLITAAENPVIGIPAFKEKKRERFLSDEEIKTLIETLSEMRNSGEISASAQNAILLLIFTGCRSGEILNLEWQNIDFRRSCILLEKHKTDYNGKKVVHLSSAALQVINKIQKQDDNKYVITGKNSGAPLVNIQKAWRKVRKQAGLNDVRLHDLRHTFASMALNAGIPLAVVGGLLGHESHQSTARYAHLANETLKTASELIGSQFNTINGENL